MLEPLAVANTPLAMLTLGAFLQLRYPNWQPDGAHGSSAGLGAVSSSVRSLVLLAHLDGLDRAAVSMGSAMPTGLAVMVYSVSEGMDAEFAAGAISLSILAGLFVMPILLSLY